MAMIAKEYNKRTALGVLDQIQWVARRWLTLHPVSLGAYDFFPSDETKREVREAVRGVLHKAWACHGDEGRVASLLSDARNVGQRIAKESMSEDNALRLLVDSGAKGNYVNLAQVIGLVGQQSVTTARIVKQLNNGERALTSYPSEGKLEELVAKDPETYIEALYESRGLVLSSFSEGLRPSEYFFHAMGGRKGLADTAIKTKKSGYIQRRAVKLNEDLRAESDGTVRDAAGNVIQFRYGGLRGLDPAESVGMGRACVDIDRLVDKHSCSCRSRAAAETVAYAEIRECLRGVLLEEDQVDLELGEWRNMRPFVDVDCAEAFLTELKEQCVKAKVAPGKPVGMCMTMALGEPTTQMVLNTFHMAGVANKKSSAGLQKVDDLTSLKTTSGICSSVKLMGGASCARLTGAVVKTLLGDLVVRTEKIHLPVGEEEKERQWWYAVHEEVPDMGGRLLLSDLEEGALGMRVHLDEDALIQRGLVPRDVCRALYRGTKNPLVENVVLVAGPGAGARGELVFDVYASAAYVAELAKNNSAHNSRAWSKDVLVWNTLVAKILQGIRGMPVCGLPDVVSAEYCAEDQTLQMEGSNLAMLANYHGVYLDFRTARSDNPKEVAEVLGVEAGRRVLLESLKDVIEFDGTKIALCHIQLLADSMSHYGSLLPMTRAGIKNTSASLLARMSFEETSTHVEDGASLGELDPLSGVSSRIAMGLLVKMGTGSCSVAALGAPTENNAVVCGDEDEDDLVF